MIEGIKKTRKKVLSTHLNNNKVNPMQVRNNVINPLKRNQHSQQMLNKKIIKKA
jgi:hypothetical protein